MAVTVNKGYPLIATGAEVDAWGALLNTDTFTVIDSNFAGVTTKSLTNVNVILSAAESQNAILNLTGILTGNVQVTTSCKGFFFVNNDTTGAFNVTVTNGVAGSVIPQGIRSIVTADATYGVKVAGSNLFPAGTRMPFNQTTVPTGWTKESSATYNDAAIRLTTGTVSTAGTSSFTTSILSARTLVALNMPNVTITVVDPGHFHSFGGTNPKTLQTGGGAPPSEGQAATQNTSPAFTGITASIDNTARGGAQTTLWDAVKYADFTIGIKSL